MILGGLFGNNYKFLIPYFYYKYYKYHYLSDIILTKIFFYRYVTKNRIIAANKSTKIG